MKRIKFGNRISRLIQPELTLASRMFEVVFDYDRTHYEEIDLTPAKPRSRSMTPSKYLRDGSLSCESETAGRKTLDRSR